MNDRLQDVFLSHNSDDKAAVERLAHQLRRRGIDPWLDTWNLIPGTPWQPAVEEALAACNSCAIFIGRSGIGPWQNEEMRAAISRRVGRVETRFRVIPVLLPGARRPERSALPTFLAATTWVEFRDSLDDEAAMHRLICGIRGLRPGAGSEGARYEGACPYQGLQFFDTDHAQFFFGREALTQWVVDRLRSLLGPNDKSRFLAIIGASGSGKTSLARAGLIPAVKRGEIPGSKGWPIVVCRPGRDPVESLSVALAADPRIGAAIHSVPIHMSDLCVDERSLHLTIRRALHAGLETDLAVVLVDQLEEIFTLCGNESLRKAFIDNLLYAASIAQGRTVVVITMRADFYAKCASLEALCRAFSDHQIFVEGLTKEELRQAIERPAQMAGCEVDAGLVETLVRDVENQAGALPLLQYALTALWERRAGTRLTLEAYRDIGRIEGALERRANEVFDELGEDKRRICRQIFLRLTQPGDGTEDTKRRARFDELLPSEEKVASVLEVTRRLTDARLITTQGEINCPEHCFVEIAHETLIRGWSKLHAWIEEDREELRVRRRLSDAVAEWERNNRDADYLYQGAWLAQAEALLVTRPELLSPPELEFIKKSMILRESGEQLRLAIEGGRMGHWVWDPATDSSLLDPRACEFLGLQESPTPRIETFLRCVDPKDRTGLHELIQKSVVQGVDFDTTFRTAHGGSTPEGDVIWLSLSCKVVRQKRDQSIRLAGALYDVTTRTKMEEALRQLNARLESEVTAQTEELRATIDRLQDEVARRVLAEGKLRTSSRQLEAFFQHTVSPLSFLDRHFHFIRVNEAYARASGQSPDFFLHEDYFSLYANEEDRAIFEQVVRTREPYHAQARLFAFSNVPGQALRYWNWHITPLLDPEGEVQFLVFSLEDVSDQQTAFAELEHRAGQLQKLTLELAQAEERERRRLAEILHDDLQQVLAAAKFHLGLLDACTRSPEQMHKIVGQVKRMLKDAIERSRSLSHELAPAVLYQSNLGDTLEWLARDVQQKHGLSVRVEVRGDVDSRSEPLRAFLFRAAQEMLFNIVQHARVGEARLRLRRRRGWLWLTIGDKGCGFDPRTLGQTTGLALFSIRERVGLLGGRMKIRSAMGHGSVFLIAVPEAPEPDVNKQKTNEDAGAQHPSSGPPLRILIVDDHKIVREGLASLIAEQPDMKIVGQASDGREAIELADKLKPDVVIMDIAIPGIPGDEATRRIKAALPQTRVVAFTTFDESGVARRMTAAGADAYVHKTAPSDALLTAIRGSKRVEEN